MDNQTSDLVLDDITTGPWKVECVRPGEPFSGENWLIAQLGADHDGNQWYITTDGVRASQLSGEPEADARAIVEWRNALWNR